MPPSLLSGMGSPEFKVRELAEEDALEWGRKHRQAALESLLKHSRVGPDPEVRARCLSVLKELVNDEYLNAGEGFMGISMLDEISLVPGDPKPRQVIWISRILKASAAEKAGLLINDRISGIDGTRWYGDLAVESFSKIIKAKKPSSKVLLEVLRDKELISVQVILGKRPANIDLLMMDKQNPDAEAAENEARDRFFSQWLERQKEGD